MQESEIVISGLSACTAGAGNLSDLQQLLYAGKCAVSQIPVDRWRESNFFHPKRGTPARSYSFAAGVVEDLWGFDAKAFGLSPREAAMMDPQQRILLKLVWEAFEDSGIVFNDLDTSRVGVYVGVSSSDYSRRMSVDPVGTSDPYLMVGNALSIVANRISHVFDFNGPSLAIDTACSSSLVAMDRAYADLLSGKIDTAVVGGINVLLIPDAFSGFAQAGMLSQKGLCQSFSANADGYVRGEGGGVVILQRSDLCTRLNGAPRAKVLASAVNTDGRTVGISLPSEHGQFSLLSSLYEENGIDPDRLLFVEAHGTGTLAGDPIEARALGYALGQKRTNALPIGSIKTNIGHLEPASGILGVIKSAVALEQQRLPASLHAQTPNPDIDFSELNLTLAQETLGLDVTETANVAGISSFGFGGVNAHVVLEKASTPGNQITASNSIETQGILAVSAKSEASLKGLLDAYRKLTTGDAENVSGLVNQSFHHRNRYEFNAVIAGPSRESISEGIEEFLEKGQAPTVVQTQTPFEAEPAVFVYSGNGAQYAGMCVAALKHDTAYVRHFNRVDEIYADLCGWSIRDIVDDLEIATKLNAAKFAQPLLFADQVAQTFALRDRGFEAAAVLGHSGGEMAAATSAGVLSLEDALKTIHERSKSQEAMRGRGGMAAVQTSVGNMTGFLKEFDVAGLTISAINSPKSVTIVGPNEPLDAFLTWLRKTKRVAGVNLRLEYPYHSPLLDEIEESFRAGVKTLNPQPANVPYYSSVFGRKINTEPLDVDYWWQLIRSPVRFHDAVEDAVGDGFKMFVECGPKPVLLNYLQDSFPEQHLYRCWNTIDAKVAEEVNPVSLALAKAVAHGAKINDPLVFGERQDYDRSLPTYCWDETELRADDTPAINNHHATKADYPALLGRELYPGSNIWINGIDAHLFPDLADHLIGGNAIMPASGYLDMALCAVRLANQSEVAELRDVDIVAPMPLSSNNIREVRTRVDCEDRTITIESRISDSGDTFTLHLSGRFNSGSPDPKFATGICDAFKSQYDENSFQAVEHLYDFGKRLGLEYGPHFQRVETFRVTSGETTDVTLRQRSEMEVANGYSSINYAEADAVFHGLLPLLELANEFTDDHGFIPVHCGCVQLFEPNVRIAFGRISIKRVGSKSVVADCIYLDDKMNPVAVLSGLRLQAVKLINELSFDEHLFQMKSVRLPDFSATDVSANPKLSSQVLANDISQLCVGFADDAAQQDYNLVEAAASVIAYEAILRQCDQGRLFVNRPPSEKLHTEDPNGKEWLQERLLGILTSSGLAEQEALGTRLAESTGLPPASEFLHDLVLAKPHLASEHRLLAFLNHEIEQVFCTGGDWNPVSKLGANRLGDLVANTTERKRLVDLIARLLKEIASKLTPVDEVNVLLVSDTGLQQIRNWSDQLQSGSVSVKCMKTAELEKLKKAHLSSDSTREPSNFDLIIFVDGLVKENVNSNLLSFLDSISKPSASILAIQPDLSKLQSLLVDSSVPGDDDALSSSSTTSDEFSTTRIESSLVREGANVVLYDKLPAFFGNRSAIVFELEANPDAQNTSTCSDTEERSGDTIAKLLAMKGFDPLEATETGFDELGIKVFSNHRHSAKNSSSDGAHHVICIEQMHVDDNSTVSPLIADRIMRISDHLIRYQSSLRNVSFFIPGGANYVGCTLNDPSQVAIWNMCRTIQNEFPEIDVSMIDTGLDGLTPKQSDLLERILEGAVQEAELILDKSGLCALRVESGLSGPVVVPETRSANRLVLQAPMDGRLDHLQWQQKPRAKPAKNQVELEVVAAGLNYRDVMWSMGLLPEEALEDGLVGPEIGMECSGRIVAVGEQVNNLKVGDMVMTVGSGCFTSHLCVDAELCIPLAAGLDPKAAATLPVAYFTAHYALAELAGLKEGDSVLIHGAAGGVGLAAIHVAASCGAEVFATAGTPDKRALLETLGVDHVLNSRTSEFASTIMHLTNGKGVDVVLNSLAGEKMEASLQVLKPFGRFLEIGKQDFFANTKIGLRPLKANTTYHGIDVDQLMAHRPDLVGKLLGEIAGKFETGDYVPIPYYAFNASDVKDAFRFMQRSSHIGKVVVEAPDEFTAVSPAKRGFLAETTGTYVVVGGSGGLGQEIVSWLLNCGATSVAVLGRSPNEQVSDVFERLPGFNGKVSYFQCDVTDKADLAKTLEGIRKAAPIVGVVHAAMYLEDASLQDLDRGDVVRTLAVKATAIDYLDELTRQDRVCQFVAISSVAAMLGNLRQAAYVSANAYMEAVIQRRRSAGLCGVSIALGAIANVGYLTRNKAAMAVLDKVSGRSAFTSAKVIKAMDRFLADDLVVEHNPNIILADMDWGVVASQLCTLRSPTFKVLHDLGTQNVDGVPTDNLRLRLQTMKEAEAKETLVRFIQSEVAKVLNLVADDVNANVPISELGMDSLMGVEFGMSMQEHLGQDIPMTTVSDGSSISDIAERLVSYLARQESSPDKESNLISRLALEHLDDSAYSAKLN